MHRGALIAAVCASVPLQAALCQQAFPVTNVTIKIIRHGGRDNFRFDAEVTNPNDFAVFDIHVDCDIKDRRGKKIVSYASTVVDAVQAREVRTIRRLDIGAWPEQGRTAYCQSSKAKRLPEG
jgi:hypothetical protein